MPQRNYSNLGAIPVYQGMNKCSRHAAANVKMANPIGYGANRDSCYSPSLSRIDDGDSIVSGVGDIRQPTIVHTVRPSGETCTLWGMYCCMPSERSIVAMLTLVLASMTEMLLPSSSATYTFATAVGMLGPEQPEMRIARITTTSLRKFIHYSSRECKP